MQESLSRYQKRVREFTQKPRTEIVDDPERLREIILSRDETVITAARMLAERIVQLKPYPGFQREKPQAMIVGGFVRDSVVGLDPKDADIEVNGVSADDLRAVLEEVFPGRWKEVGKAFGIIKVELTQELELDVSIPRRRGGDEDTGLDDGDPLLLPEEAAVLRDFSFNNLFADPITGTIYDVNEGIKDLRERRLRLNIPTHFAVDPIRVYRGCQFCARMELWPDEETLRLMRECVDSGAISTIHPRRLTEEVHKLLLKPRYPSIGLELMRISGLLKAYHPTLAASVGTPLPGQKDDLWTETLEYVDRTRREIDREDLELHSVSKLVSMLAALLDRNCALASFAEGSESIETTLKVVQNALKHWHFGYIIQCAIACSIHWSKSINELNEKFPVEKKAPAPKAAATTRGAGMGLPVRRPIAPQSSPYSLALEELLNEAYPARWNTIYPISQAKSPTRRFEAGERFLEAVKEAKLNEKKRGTLLDKTDLTDELGLDPGVHIGFIIGEVEKHRLQLLTKKRALDYVRDNLDALMLASEEAISS